MHYIEAVHARMTIGWCQERGEHLDSRALARAVRSKQSKDLSFLHYETNVVNSTLVAKFFQQMTYFDNDRHTSRYLNPELQRPPATARPYFAALLAHPGPARLTIQPTPHAFSGAEHRSGHVPAP